MTGPTYGFAAPLWQYDGPGGWHFLTLPEDLADEILERASGQPRSFGSVPVVVTIGSTTWSTSLFASKASGSYVLPVKAQVRREARLSVGDLVECSVQLTR